MKKTNLYYKTIVQRKEVAKDVIIVVFLFFISWPRLLMEVFLRKNFGERYFSLGTVIFLATALFFVPIGVDKLGSIYSGGYSSTISIIFKNITWYIYLAALLYVSFLRRQEIKREIGTFDFNRYSCYDGDIHPRFYEFKFKGKPATRRQISIFLEPGFLFLIGVVLYVCQQLLGPLIIFCSLCYATGYQGDYIRGDHFILDTIDEMIANEHMVESFVDGRKPEETNGFEMKGNGPINPDLRKQVVDNIIDTEPASEAF